MKCSQLSLPTCTMLPTSTTCTPKLLSESSSVLSACFKERRYKFFTLTDARSSPESGVSDRSPGSGFGVPPGVPLGVLARESVMYSGWVLGGRRGKGHSPFSIQWHTFSSLW